MARFLTGVVAGFVWLYAFVWLFLGLGYTQLSVLADTLRAANGF